MTRYCLGFLFSPDLTSCVLIKKEKPEAQQGLWNGVGGKIEANEDPYVAMQREFKEETNVLVPAVYWHKINVMCSDNWIMHVFTATSELYNQVESITDEEVSVFKFREALLAQTLPNIPWLWQMAKTQLTQLRIKAKTDCYSIICGSTRSYV